jgi:hypothetical protein
VLENAFMVIDRRGFLGTLALAPAALAACSTGAAAGKPGRRAASEVHQERPAPPSTPLAALRAFALPADAEPAFTFRAAPVRAGGG